MSRIVNLSNGDIGKLSSLVDHWVARNAIEYKYFESRALVAHNDPLVDLSEIYQLAPQLGSNILDKACKQRKNELQNTPISKWHGLLADFEKSAIVEDSALFQDAISNLIARHPPAEGVDESLLVGDKRTTDDVISTTWAEFPSHPNNQQAAVAQFIASRLSSAKF